MKDTKQFSSAVKDDTRADKTAIIDSSELFRQNPFVYIEHEGQKYILRVTRENKLILTK